MKGETPAQAFPQDSKEGTRKAAQPTIPGVSLLGGLADSLDVLSLGESRVKRC